MLLRDVKQRLAEPGVLEAVLAYYRQGTDTGTEAGKASRALAQQAIPVPTLALCGEDDACIAAEVFRGAMCEADFPAGVEVQCIENTGHFLHLEQPARVNEQLLSWLLSKHQRLNS